MAPFKKHIILTLTFLTSYLGSYAQNAPVIEAFRAVENNGKVQLSWVMTEGSICNGIVIQRSTDSINFEYIGSIPGLCGNISSAETYVFIDPSPILNRTVYYRLEFGGLTYSNTISIEIYDITSGNRVIPNPAIHQTTIHFSNRDNSEHTLLLYSHDKQIAEYKTTEAEFKLDMSNYQPGSYYFYIYHEKKGIITRGKVLKGY